MRPIPKAPFHRRILPVIFVIVFITVAPVVLFYTAGYRWNPKKGKVERNGTVIIDSTPTNASISIDGQISKDRTPVTFQEIVPGSHHFSVSLDGYFPWSKALDVYAERVTFANSIILWKRLAPQFILATTSTFMSSAQTGSSLLTGEDARQITIYDSSAGQTRSLKLTDDMARPELVSWTDNGRYALVEAGQTNWLIDSFGRQEALKLPPGFYRFVGSQIVGTEKNSLLNINLSDFSLKREIMSGGVSDKSESSELITATGTHDLIYVAQNRPREGLVLQPGNWRYWSTARDHVLLRDGNRWMALQANKKPPEYHTAIGALPMSLLIQRETHYLLVNDTELWLWNPLQDPELIFRQSDKILGAAWHRTGNDVFFATAKSVYALNLDTRDGRSLTDLADFDLIRGFAQNNDKLLILGTKNGEQGLWQVDYE
ncbi:MAG: PEGA domain-containing protein [Patescibacteria group bacterium]